MPYQRILSNVLHDGVEHLQQRISCCALDVRRIAADGHVEHCPHRLTAFQNSYNVFKVSNEQRYLPPECREVDGTVTGSTNAVLSSSARQGANPSGWHGSASCI